MIFKRGIGEKGQVVIPKDIRKYLGLDVGVDVIFEIKDDNVILKREENGEDFLRDFLDVPKIKRKISVKELKKVYEEQYERHIH